MSRMGCLWENEMIDIYARGVDLLGVNMTMEQMDAIMDDDIVKDDYFIPFRFDNGKLGAVKKGEIQAYTETFEEAKC